MRISEIIQPPVRSNQQAILSKYQQGKEAEFLFPDGTKITKDLKVAPNIFSQDANGKVIANIASPVNKPGQQTMPIDKQLVPGSRININLSNKPM